MSDASIHWNPKVNLICADVDQTVADDFLPAEPAMIHELNTILSEGVRLFFVTGGPLARLRIRVIDRLDPELRQHILVSHCSGAEVWGFDADGQQHDEPFYSVYDAHMTEEQKLTWRQIVDELVAEFKLKKYPPQPVEQFRNIAGDDPLSIIYEDRGPQITLEVINGYDMTKEQYESVLARLPDVREVVDLREPMLAWIDARLKEQAIPVTPHLAGIFALDLPLAGVSKTQSVERVLASKDILGHLGLSAADLRDPEHLEIWGDRFDETRGTDWRISAALDPRVRSIDFRREDPRHFPKGYSIAVWDGNHELQEGTLEYLQSR